MLSLEIETLRKLFSLQIRESGISRKTFDSLPDSQKALLVEREGKYFLSPSERMKIRVGLAGGVFDIVHIGHVLTLNEAKKHCDALVVAIARDEMIAKKGRKPVHTQEARAAMVEFLKPVDAVVLGRKDYREILDFVKPDVIIYGYDQEEFAKPAGVEIVKLEKRVEPEKFKSSRIIRELGL